MPDQCQQCGAELSPGAGACPRCQTPTPVGEAPSAGTPATSRPAPPQIAAAMGSAPWVPGADGELEPAAGVPMVHDPHGPSGDLAEPARPAPPATEPVPTSASAYPVPETFSATSSPRSAGSAQAAAPVPAAPVATSAPVPAAPLPAAPAAPAPIPAAEPAPAQDENVLPFRVRLTFTDGSQQLLDSDAVVGRKPQAVAEAEDVAAVQLLDPMKSSSRVHLRVHLREEGVSVVDAGSGNGTRVEHENRLYDCQVGQPFWVVPGDTVWLGEVPVVIELG